MKVFQNIETLPVLIMNYFWGREQKWYRVRVRIVSPPTFGKTRTAISAGLLQNTHRYRRAQSGNFGDLITAAHKFLSGGSESRNNHRYAAVVQDLATQWIQSYPCKTKTSQETQRSLQKFLEPNRKPKVIYTDNSMEFGKACEE